MRTRLSNLLTAAGSPRRTAAAFALLLGITAYFIVERYLSRIHATRAATIPPGVPLEPTV